MSMFKPGDKVEELCPPYRAGIVREVEEKAGYGRFLVQFGSWGPFRSRSGMRLRLYRGTALEGVS